MAHYYVKSKLVTCYDRVSCATSSLRAVSVHCIHWLAEKVRAHHACPAAATLASSPPTRAIQDLCAGVQSTARSPACVSGGRLPTCVCHWTPTAFVGHRHVRCLYCLAQRTNTRLGDHSFTAAGPRVWNSLSNPAARVGHYSSELKTHLFDH